MSRLLFECPRFLGRRFGAVPMLCLFLVAAALPAAPGTARAEARQPDLEYQVKASMLYNFIQFVEWPPDALGAAEPIALCVIGQDRFGPALDALRNELVRGHPIDVRRLQSFDAARSCHLLFVGADASERAREWFGTLSSESVLTVGESSRFLEHGGVINFVVDKGKLRFEINSEASRRARLSISSRLLRLAMRVTPDDE